ncbi:MAG TPA: beta-ketoacyl synthase N-terminal-like domain-containing protein, partial [Arenibaculum sp.]|nr:beta-ketoacyl synthase N-terminal-like domain-containing protein [Arenibaculum sp.]
MEKIAIIGMSCLFPGAHGAGDYWQNLMAGEDSRSAGSVEDFGAPIERFLADGPAPDRIYSIRGGFVRDFTFDPADLDLAPELHERLDTVFKWSLHAAREALRDAGLLGRRDQLAESGLILGNYTFPTFASNRLVTPLWRGEIAAGLEEAWGLPEGSVASLDRPAGDDPATRYVCGMPAATAAGTLGLAGPSFSLDAACSSAIYAIDLASAYLRAGRAKVMLAGGVCAPDPWLIHLSFSALGAYPANGISPPFDARSKGIVTGQGASVVALKRLADAQADGNTILAVIDGIGLSNDGAGRHTLAPNPRGQVIAYERAYEEAGIDPAEIDYIECHATGTPLGDRTELSSLDTYFTPRGGVPRIGSVKGNVGHLLTVAGMSSLAKVTMAMREGMIPATIGVTDPQPFANPDTPADRIIRANEPWPNRKGPRRAAISAFGFGGTNAHMVVSHPADQPAEPRIAQHRPAPVAITGMAAHFGELDTLARFERAMFRGDAVLGRPPSRRWRGVAGEDAPHGAYIDGIDLDPVDYRIPPAELLHFNPQQALILKVADAALRDAGFDRKAPTQPRNVAVLVALELDLTAHLRRARADLPEVLDGYLEALGLEVDGPERARLVEVCGDALHGEVKSSEILSYIGNLSASRISSLWNFTGPSYTVSSDGLGVAYALEVAQLILAEGKAEAVLVAAVDLAAGFEHHRLNGSAGPAMGEGAGAVVMVPPDRASADGRGPYAVLDAISVRREHRVAEALFAARPETVEAAMKGVPPAAYVELGAFGDAGRDGAEIAAVARAVPGATVGAITKAIGQPGVAAPMASLIKTALALWRRYLPAMPGWQKPDARHAEAMAAGRLSVASDSLPWIRRDDSIPVRATVSVAGLSGGHAAVGLAEAGEPRPVTAGQDDDLVIVVAQGADRPAIEADLDRLIGEMEAGTAPPVLQRGTLAAYRPGQAPLAAVLLGRDAAALLKEARKLRGMLAETFASGQPFQTPAGSYFTPTPLGGSGKIAFVYPGGFNSYPHLGRSLFRAFPDVLRSFEARLGDPAEALCAGHLYPLGPNRIGPKALMKLEAAMQHDIATMIISGASFALLYTEILRDCLGIRPDGAFGYSLGETSMLFANGAWPVEARSIDRLRTTELF